MYYWGKINKDRTVVCGQYGIENEEPDDFFRLVKQEKLQQQFAISTQHVKDSASSENQKI